MVRRGKPRKVTVDAKRRLVRRPARDPARKARDLAKRLAEALDQQSATSEILRVISRSPGDVQPVFDAIVRHAVRLCGGRSGILVRYDGELMHLAAHHNMPLEGVERNEVAFPRPPDQSSPSGATILARTIIHVPDLQASARFAGSPAQRSGNGSVIAVPLLHDGAAIGAIVVSRQEVGGFSEGEIALLQTFADQAVIAIENVRLFTELEARNRDLTETLEQKTATSEILRVIASSPTDLQPVFDTIVTSAVRLLGGFSATLRQRSGEQLDLVAFSTTSDSGDEALRGLSQLLLAEDPLFAQVVLDRTPRFASDTETDSRVGSRRRDVARARGYRAMLLVPMLSGGSVIGVITVTRRDPGPFTDDQIALLQTFADQAVIAIENARLFRELQARTADMTRSVEQLTALGEVGRAVSSTLDLETVLTTIVTRAVQLSGLDGGVVFEYDGDAEEFVHRAATETGGALAEARRATRVRKGEGVVGRTATTLDPAAVPDITMPGADESRLRENLIASGVRAVLAVPMVYEDRLIGCLVVSRNQAGDFPTETIELLRTFATQSALAIQNARLFREIADTSRQLEAASRHKSEFLANMSHELRTPLNAIIGYSEMLQEEAQDRRQDALIPDLEKINAAAKHQLSLINDILDLSKVEAGRMDLELIDVDLPSAIDTALTLLRERATRQGITLGRTIGTEVGSIRADERKLKQVLLNLLSNALKFTPAGGRIDVGATVNEGLVEVSVADTGVGIAAEDREAVFEEFRQVGAAHKKGEGTGLGLALCRKFVELHGGRIWVTSQVGQGSTFTFTLPVRREG
jgi:signal transduction histidine kinase